MSVRAWLATGAWLSIACFSAPASPCGAFVARATKTVPSLAVEQTLIVFDPDKELEHFVRQIAIRDPSPGFGFVVPVPEQPTVAKVKVDPFEKLVRSFPLGSRFSLGSGGGAPGGSRAAGAGAVTVVSREKVGSFTAFVLTASDAVALNKWFADNRLSVPPEAQAWLDGYVKLGFYFVALRYEAQARDQNKSTTRAETIRISFKTPLPFYPYREPAHAKASDAPRDLAVWLVSTQAYTPVSLFSGAAWKRPLLEHSSEPVPRESLVPTLDGELLRLLPDGALSVQVFEDQKRSRAGFGDIVMVPKVAKAPNEAALARSRKLMALLDPAVTP
jgi:hypothetical protein